MAKRKLKMDSVESIVETFLEDARNEVEALQGELENWRDGLMGTNLENSGIFESLEDAIDSMSGITDRLDSVELELSDKLADAKIRLNIYKPTSRPKRLSNAITMLHCVVDFLNDNEVEEENSSEIEEAVGELEGIDMPSPFRG